MMYWGALEAFHWNREDHRPIGFSPRRNAKHHCRLRASTQPPHSLRGRPVSYGMLYKTNLGLVDTAVQANATVLGPFGFAKVQGPLVIGPGPTLA